MGFDINSFILNRPFLDHLKDFSQIFAKPDISFFCGGTLNHFLVVGKHSICMEVATFLFVRPFGVLRYPCIISPSRTFRSTPLDSHIPVLFWNVLNGYTDTRHTYMAPTYLPGALPTISMVHGSIFQTTQGKAAKVHWLILIRCNGWGWVLLDISTLKIAISLHPSTFYAVSPTESIVLNCPGTRFKDMVAWWIYKQIGSNCAKYHPILPVYANILSPMDLQILQ